MSLIREVKYLLVTIAYFALFIINKHEASSFPLTGQYMGTQSSGNEHVLLFKLPKSLSNQMQEQLLQVKTSGSFGDQILLQANEQHQSDQKSTQLEEEQPLSLTIPLTTLASVNQPEYVYAIPRHSDKIQQRLRMTPNYHDSSLVDYLSSETNGHEVIEQKPVDSSYLPSLTVNSQNENQDEQGQQQQQQQYQVTNLTSIEQHMRHYLQQQTDNFTTTSLPSVASTTDQPNSNQQEQQPQLWLDSHKSSLHEPTRMNNQSELNHQLSTSLLAKLAASSPDLLLRLKSLLQRAATHNQQQAENSSSDYPRGEISGTSQDLQALKLLGKSSTGDRTLLSTFLSSQNLSSHEEIEIPLVVIAMPRIVSLKRNQLSSNYPKSVNSLNGQYLNENTPTNNNLTSNGPFKLSILDLSQNNTNTNYTSQIPNYTYIAKKAIPYGLQQAVLEATKSQQDSISTPQHTMAPYARQFSFLSSSHEKPYFHQQKLQHYQPNYQVTATSNTLNQSHNSYVAPNSEYREPSNKSNLYTDRAVQLIYPSSQSASTESSQQQINAIQPNISKLIQLSQPNPSIQGEEYQQQLREIRFASLLGNNRERKIPQMSNRYQIQMQEVNPTIAIRQHQIPLLLDGHSRLSTESVTYPQVSDLPQTRFDHSAHHPDRIQQGYNETGENVWINEQAQHVARPTEYLLSTPNGYSSPVLSARPARAAAAISDVASAQNRIAILEQRLARLRPLFRSGNNRQWSGSNANVDIKDQLRFQRNKLTREQMLSFLPQYEQQLDLASAAIKRLDQMAPKVSINPSFDSQKDEAKKQAKMVLMIV